MPAFSREVATSQKARRPNQSIIHASLCPEMQDEFRVECGRSFWIVRYFGFDCQFTRNVRVTSTALVALFFTVTVKVA